MADTPEAVMDQAEENMDKALGALDRNFGRVRTGRASLTLLDGIRVDYYGTPTPVSWAEAGRVLVGLAAEGGEVRLGPYFWVMHTSFIPTLAFLLVVGAA